MRKELLFAVLFLSLLAANVFAEEEITFWGGYTTVKMGALNGFINLKYRDGGKIKDTFKLESKEIKNAFIVGVDYLLIVDENIKVGPRVAFLKTNNGVLNVNSQGNNYYYEYKSSLMPLMIGGSYSENINKNFSWNCKLFFGVALVKFTENIKVIYLDSGVSAVDNDNYGSSCFAADLSIGTKYSFTERFGLGVDLGYRHTPILYPIKGSKTCELDFSGLTTTLGLSIKYRLNDTLGLRAYIF